MYQGCSRTSEEEKLKIYQEIFQEVTYDKRIDQHNKAFEDLNLFLYPKLEEILKFKNVKHIMGGGDTTRVSYRERNDMTLVYKNIDENVPPEYTDELSQLWDIIGTCLLYTSLARLRPRPG